MPKPGQRDFAKEDYWRSIFQKFRQSGLTKSQFCRNEGLKPSTFCSWGRVIGRRDQEATVLRRRERSRRAMRTRRRAMKATLDVAGSTDDFVRVHVAPSQASSSPQAIEILRPDGLLIRIPVELGIDLLLTLLNSLPV